MNRLLYRVSAAWVVALALAAVPAGAAAHGGVTGPGDVVQDYGVLVFLLAVVLIGAAVVLWVLRAPVPVETEETGEGDNVA